MTPFIKWVGGKTQLLDKIFDKFPSNIENYYVFLHLLKRIEDGKIK
jgi:site-specific DNA-adenine methylase